jgi:hypothetical protein
MKPNPASWIAALFAGLAASGLVAQTHLKHFKRAQLVVSDDFLYAQKADGAAGAASARSHQ